MTIAQLYTLAGTLPPGPGDADPAPAHAVAPVGYAEHGVDPAHLRALADALDGVQAVMGVRGLEVSTRVDAAVGGDAQGHGVEEDLLRSETGPGGQRRGKDSADPSGSKGEGGGHHFDADNDQQEKK